MPYARLDDRYDDHRKIKKALRLEPISVAVHAMSITYCNRHNTDGELDADWVEEKLALMPLKPARRARVIEVLLDTGLFERNGDDYRVHDFLDWNRSRAQRQELAERGRSGGLAKAKATAKPPLQDGPSRGLAVAKPPPELGSSTPTPTPTPRHETSSSEASPSDLIDPADEKLCTLFRQLALERNAKFKVKSRDRWLNDMRLLRERDDNTPEEIERAIRFVFRDSFWGGVIQSPGNLREHFAAIWDKATGNGGMRPATEHAQLDAERLEAAQRLLRGSA